MDYHDERPCSPHSLQVAAKLKQYNTYMVSTYQIVQSVEDL